MKPIRLNIDEIVLLNFKPYDNKFRFTMILKHKGIDQLIMHSIRLEIVNNEFGWWTGNSDTRWGAYKMNKKFGEKLSKAIYTILKSNIDKIKNLSDMNMVEFSSKQMENSLEE